MELDLIQASLVEQKLRVEVQWLEACVTQAPEGLRTEMQAILNNRQIALDALVGQIAKVLVAVPLEAQEAANKYIVAEQPSITETVAAK